MNGIHDMGGMDGFGPVVREQNEPVFHAEWEGRVLALSLSLARRLSPGSFDEFRHAVERIPPAQYLASSYYERWLAAAETLLVEHGVVTREELLAKQSDSTEFARALIAPGVRAVGPAPSKEKPGEKPPRARFAIGDRVRARNLNPPGHTRIPRYARGKRGVIARDWGVFVFPDTNAHHAGTRPQHCYSVRFEARELWGKSANARERVHVDLWEGYLDLDREPGDSNSKPKPRRRVTTKRKK
jgi:nitrile hydratase subunit beta